MFKKVSRTRAFVCMLVMFALLAVWAFAEPALNNEAPAPEETTELATPPASEEEESEPLVEGMGIQDENVAATLSELDAFEAGQEQNTY